MLKNMFLFIFLTLATQSYGATKVGTVSCNVLKPSTWHVSADVYGHATQDGSVAEYANIELSKFNRKTGESKTLKTWSDVALAEPGGLSWTFKDDVVSFEPWFDDVGASSELTYDGKTLQLQCDVSVD